MIFKYLTSIVKPCVFKLFSLRKITKSNFYHHLPTLNIANLFMQSFASPLPSPPQSPHPTKITHHKTNTTFYTTPHKKGATITYPYALSTKKSIERAQLSLIPTPFLPKKQQKGRNYRLYLRPFYQKIHRKGATIAYTHALSTQKTIERAQLSLVLAKNITIFAKKQINHNYYDKQRINRKSL